MQGFFWVLLETLGIILGFGFVPSRSSPTLELRPPPPPPWARYTLTCMPKWPFRETWREGDEGIFIQLKSTLLAILQLFLLLRLRIIDFVLSYKSSCLVLLTTTGQVFSKRSSIILLLSVNFLRAFQYSIVRKDRIKLKCRKSVFSSSLFTTNFSHSSLLKPVRLLYKIWKFL